MAAGENSDAAETEPRIQMAIDEMQEGTPKKETPKKRDPEGRGPGGRGPGGRVRGAKKEITRKGITKKERQLRTVRDDTMD